MTKDSTLLILLASYSDLPAESAAAKHIVRSFISIADSDKIYMLDFLGRKKKSLSLTTYTTKLQLHPIYRPH